MCVFWDPPTCMCESHNAGAEMKAHGTARKAGARGICGGARQIWTRPLTSLGLSFLSFLICKMGVPLGLALQAFCMKGLERIRDENIWRIIGAQTNGGYPNYDRAEAMLSSNDS